MLAADGEDDAGLLAIGNGNEHGCGYDGLRALLGEIAPQQRAGWRRGQGGTQPLGERHGRGSSGKNFPSLQIPTGS